MAQRAFAVLLATASAVGCVSTKHSFPTLTEVTAPPPKVELSEIASHMTQLGGGFQLSSADSTLHIYESLVIRTYHGDGWTLAMFPYNWSATSFQLLLYSGNLMADARDDLAAALDATYDPASISYSFPSVGLRKSIGDCRIGVFGVYLGQPRDQVLTTIEEISRTRRFGEVRRLALEREYFELFYVRSPITDPCELSVFLYFGKDDALSHISVAPNNAVLLSHGRFPARSFSVLREYVIERPDNTEAPSSSHDSD